MWIAWDFTRFSQDDDDGFIFLKKVLNWVYLACIPYFFFCETSQFFLQSFTEFYDSTTFCTTIFFKSKSWSHYIVGQKVKKVQAKKPVKLSESISRNFMKFIYLISQVFFYLDFLKFSSPLCDRWNTYLNDILYFEKIFFEYSNCKVDNWRCFFLLSVFLWDCRENLIKCYYY